MDDWAQHELEKRDKDPVGAGKGLVGRVTSVLESGEKRGPA